jgi:hypothetical protein
MTSEIGTLTAKLSVITPAADTADDDISTV